MGNPCRLQLWQRTQSTSTLPTEILLLLLLFYLQCSFSHSFHTLFHLSISPVSRPTQITHLVTMKGIAECSCELTQFVQCKGLEFQFFCIYSFYHLPHRCNCIFPVEDDPADSHFPENFDCLPVHFSGFTAKMDLTGYAFLSQVQNQCRIGKDEAVESDFHTLFHNVCNLFILFRNIIEGIHRDMYRLSVLPDHC